jgi:hypothetical protein
MRIELETIREEVRFEQAAPCWLCGRRFVMGAVAAWAYSSTIDLDCGLVCPTCLEEGEEAMEGRLEKHARWPALEAEDYATLAAEGVEAPTLEEFRMFELVSISAP